MHDEWIEALRSGKYEQGIMALCRNNKFCCMGVLADIRGVPYTLIDEEYGGYKVYNFNGIEVGNMPPKGWTGLPHEVEIYLADLNDKGASFEHIADLLSHPDTLASLARTRT